VRHYTHTQTHTHTHTSHLSSYRNCGCAHKHTQVTCIHTKLVGVHIILTHPHTQTYLTTCGCAHKQNTFVFRQNTLVFIETCGCWRTHPHTHTHTHNTLVFIRNLGMCAHTCLYTSFHVCCTRASSHMLQGVSPLSVKFTWINSFIFSVTFTVPVMLGEFSKIPFYVSTINCI
jgi:hypothetical protein